MQENKDNKIWTMRIIKAGAVRIIRAETEVTESIIRTGSRS